MTEEKDETKTRFEGQWHFRPEVPISVSPFFSWPPKPLRMGKWVVDRWFSIAENSILVVVASVCWFFFQPSLAEAKTLSPGWILEIYVRNLVLLLVVAGGLHLYFYRWRKQASRLQYDDREMKAGSRVFTFGNQVRDNMLWSLGSGVFFWT